MDPIIRIDTKHVKHKTWYTRVSVGTEKKSTKEFGLRPMDRGYRVYVPFGSSTNFKDFDSQDAALEFCKTA